jgi:hypothetical protein
MEIRNLLNFSEAANEFVLGNVTSSNSNLVFAGLSRPSFQMSDANAGASAVAQLHTPIAKANSDYIASMAVAKQTGTSHFAAILLNYTGGTTSGSRRCVIHPRLGTITHQDGVSAEVLDDGVCWRVVFRALETTDNTLIQLRFFPAYNTTGGSGASGAATGTTEITGLQLEQATAVTDYQKKPF